MGRKIRSLGIAVTVGCLMALSVTAQAADPPAPGRTRIEIETMPVYYDWYQGPDMNMLASPAYDATASGGYVMACRKGWVFIENIVAPADGYYPITYRMKAPNANAETRMYQRSDQWEGTATWNFGPPAQTTWYDYVWDDPTGPGGTWLSAGANTLEIGSVWGWFQIDYIEFDTSAGLRFEPVLTHRPLRIEAESAVLTGVHAGGDITGKDSAVVETEAGSSGGAYLAFHNPGGVTTTATYTFNIPVGGLDNAYAYYIRIAARHPVPVAPDGTGAEAWDRVLINGVDVARTDLAYNDADWHEEVLAEYAYWCWNLVEGDNTIEIRSDWFSMQYDYIQIDGMGTEVVPEGDITLTGTMQVGNTITLTAPLTTNTRSSFGNWNYGWMLNGEAVTGATERNLVIDSLSSANNGDYTVSYLQNEGDELVSNPFTVTASSAGAEPIVSNPAPGFIEEGGPLTLTAPAGGLSYQWRYDGGDLSDTERVTGVNNRVLVFDPVMLDDAGPYTCVYDDGVEKTVLETPVFNLEVLPAGSVPVAGIIGLAMLAATTACGGVLVVRRKKH